MFKGVKEDGQMEGWKVVELAAMEYRNMVEEGDWLYRG